MNSKKPLWTCYVPEHLLENISIVIPIAKDETKHHDLLKTLEHTDAQVIISSESSRAKSLNAGANKASKDYLWFLHADSDIDVHAIVTLSKAIKEKPHAIHYLNLAYDEGLAKLNAYGANMRSRLFGLPYGDQGYCMHRSIFKNIGGYPEDAPYGEDLLFIRKAKTIGIKLNNIPATITTSARQYKKIGWLKLTCYRQWQLFKLLTRKN